MLNEILHSISLSNHFFPQNILGSLLGWVGTCAYLSAYLLLVLGVLKSSDKIYHLLNIAGAVGLIIHSFRLSDWPNIIVNLVWAAIALMALFILYREKRRSNLNAKAE